MDLLASGLGVVQLPDALRFREDWEKEASLRLRAGDAEVLTEYADQGRITGAPPDEAKAIARRTYVAEYLAGRAPLMMAASNELVDEMNAAIRDDLRHLGLRPGRRPRGRTDERRSAPASATRSCCGRSTTTPNPVSAAAAWPTGTCWHREHRRRPGDGAPADRRRPADR